jgi:tetratricopeptide (TPR) repeat protein
MCTSLGLNPKGRSDVVRMRLLDHVRRRMRPETWRPGVPQQAALLTRLGHSDAAARLWESAIQLDEPALWVGLGQAQLGAGDPLEAAKSFDQAAQMGDAAANLHRAESLAAAQDFEGAARACDIYLAARPGDLRGLLLKSIFLARGGWTEEAARVMRGAFESHSDVKGLWSGLATLLLKGGRHDAAAEAYHEAIREGSKDAEIWINRGVALLLAGRTREAIGAFREVLETDPQEAVALNNLGIAYLREGQMKSAAVNLERAAKHMEVPQILLNVAKVQEAAHQNAAALESYTRILELRPTDAEAVAAQKRLRPRKVPRPVRVKTPRKRKAKKRTILRPARAREARKVLRVRRTRKGVPRKPKVSARSRARGRGHRRR